MSTFIVYWFSKVFCSSSIEITILLYSSILFASAFTLASSLASSGSCYSSSCNKSGLFFFPESDCSIELPVKLACMPSTTGVLLKNHRYLGILIASDQPNVQLYDYLSKNI